MNRKLDILFEDKYLFNEVYTFYSKLSHIYSTQYYENKKTDYNNMIKQEIDYSILKSSTELVKIVDCSDRVKQFIKM